MALGGALGLAWAPVTPLHFAWQAWHKLTPTFVSRGRRGTHGTGWRAWTGLGACDAAALCVAGVAQPDIHLRFTWQAWHKLTSTFVSRGRRGTHGTGWRPWAGIWRRGAAPLCVAGVAQSDIHLRFTWQACHNLTSTVVLRGRRATYGTGWRPWAGIWRRGAAPHFAWQAWHNLTSTFVSRGRRGTNSHLLSFCVAGEPLMVLGGALGPGFGAGAPRHFAWQAWHNLTSTFVSRGRRGTISHLPSFCVAGVPLVLWCPWAGIWRRGAAPLCVAGVAQPDIHLRFTWQAWHKLTSTVVLRGRRATYGTGWRPWAGIWRLGFLACLRMLCAGLSVLWSRRHVVFSDLFSSSHRLFYLETVSGFSSTPFWSRTYLQTES